MKPRYAKIITNNENVQAAFDWITSKDRYYYWAALRHVVECMEKAGYTVSIKKDEQEYNY